MSDIHGNIHALTAVKKFLAEKDALENVIIIGDLVGYGASPGPVIDFIQREDWTVGIGSSDLRVSMGLGEREGRKGISDQVLQWTKKTLSTEQIDFLRQLRSGGRIKTPAGKVRFFHGSPQDPEQRVDMMAQEHELAELADQLASSLVVIGGTHVPFMRTVGETIFVDPGSVGLSLNHEPGADVVIADCSGGSPKVSLHKVAYDYNSSAFDILAWNLPPEIADVIRTGRMG